MAHAMEPRATLPWMEPPQTLQHAATARCMDGAPWGSIHGSGESMISAIEAIDGAPSAPSDTTMGVRAMEQPIVSGLCMSICACVRICGVAQGGSVSESSLTLTMCSLTPTMCSSLCASRVHLWVA
jgi:hypothetical protein